VLSTTQVPPTSLYTGQTMHEGLNYIKMRDGIYLAATVRLPPGKTLADGPFPTVIEYSGYQIAAPHNLINALLDPSKYPRNDPLLPDTATAVGSVVAPLLGFASVSLQMRGTGCSGGAFDLFGATTAYDGYDAVETVAHQSWVKNHKVGLVGISFSGISQFEVAGTRPPDLAAIAPMSATNDLYATGYPGGIFNDGFAASWIAARFADSQPAPGGGEAYAKALVAAGDKQCIADQKLRLQTLNVESVLAQASHRNPSLYNVRSPEMWATKINVPVFLSGASQDEQTGGQWPALISALKNDPNVWVTLTNGTHADSLGPAIISRWGEFLDIFVANEVPKEPPVISALGNGLYGPLTGAPAEPIPQARFTNAPNVAAAKADFIKNDPRVRVLFDNGNGSVGPGALQPTWEGDYSSWPPPQSKVTRFYLGSG
ncbi:MAG TPA: CocE/NonD family hydrolase, partial [Acidimicrobiales bacterium]|nr:CocE/NonD family hydrolase [Acidimicrobiales bacterium]